MMSYLFAFVLVLSLIVLVHEGGHFIVARWCGVRVEEFSVGFGKELWGWTDKHKTRWKICLLPLGGYVKMFGDEDASSTKTSQKVPAKERKFTFMAQPLWKRACIIFAGPAMNYVFAIVLLTGLFFTMGKVIVPPVVGSVLPDSPAQEADLQKGDRILSINGKPIEGFQEIVRFVRLKGYGKPLTLEIQREETDPFLLVIKPRPIQEKGTPLIGILPENEIELIERKLTFLQSIKESFQTAWDASTDTLLYLKQILFEKRAATDMRGPLGIIEASGDALKGGALMLLLFVVQISIAVGFMNLLPIPVLDGGHLALYAIEAVMSRPLSEKAQTNLLRIGVSILLLLMVWTFFLDVPRIWQRIFS